MSDDTKLFGSHIDAELAELATERLDYGEKKEVINDLAEAIAYGGRWDERTPVDLQIERKEDLLGDLRDKRRQTDSRIESVEQELNRLRQRREKMRSTEDQLEAALVGIESELRGGRRVFEKMGPVQSIAREFEMDPTAVIDKLKSRNPDVPDSAFTNPDDLPPTEKTAARKPHRWDGLAPDEQHTPVDERGGDGR